MFAKSAISYYCLLFAEAIPKLSPKIFAKMRKKALSQQILSFRPEKRGANERDIPPPLSFQLYPHTFPPIAPPPQVERGLVVGGRKLSHYTVYTVFVPVYRVTGKADCWLVAWYNISAQAPVFVLSQTQRETACEAL